MVKLFHNLSLCHGILDLVVLDKLLLGHRLHRVDLPRVLLLDLEDFAKASLTQRVHDLEVFEAQATMGQRHRWDLFVLFFFGLFGQVGCFGDNGGQVLRQG